MTDFATSALVIKACGPATSIQDRGRFGFQRYGVSPAGAMDPLFLAAANLLVGAPAEAAALEGASRAQYFRRVLFPLLMPTTLFVLVNALINSVRMVDHLFVMTRGGPDNASALLLYYIYQVGFSFWDSAYAAALTVVVLVVLGVTAFVKFRFLDRRTHYQ